MSEHAMPFDFRNKVTERRPDLTADYVALKSAEDILEPFLGWLKSRGSVILKTPAEFKLVLAEAFKTSPDMFAITKAIGEGFGLPADEKLYQIVSDQAFDRRLHHRAAIQDWVMRNVIRFPAKEGDNVNFWRNEDGRRVRRAGIVLAVDPTSASAVVRLIWAKDRTADRVNSEDIDTIIAAAKLAKGK
jgi:hypothetical protein